MTGREIVYAVLTLLGVVSTWYFNLAFMEEAGGSFSIADFVAASYANNASSSIANDLAVGSTAFLIWSFYEARRLAMRNWWLYFALTFTVAFAFSCPLFLLMRERKMAQ